MSAHNIALLMPGQGSQFVGMGRDLADAQPRAAEAFEQANDVLGIDLRRICWEGPDEELTRTENAQPAILLHSYAVWICLPEPVRQAVGIAAGHSLGEYSALAAAGTFSIADAARLLRTRGDAMQKATPVGTGAMAALLGLDYEAAAKVAAEAAQGDVCQAANDNAPGQVVVSGSKAAVERAVEIAKTHGAKRAMLLPVSAPFHCALMQPAADVMAESLAGVTMNDPAVPLIANVEAGPVSDAATIRENLVKQVTGTVRWRECVEWMAANGVTVMVELGAGKVLTGMARRMAPDANCMATASVADLEAVAAALKA